MISALINSINQPAISCYDLKRDYGILHDTFRCTCSGDTIHNHRNVRRHRHRFTEETTPWRPFYSKHVHIIYCTSGSNKYNTRHYYNATGAGLGDLRMNRMCVLSKGKINGSRLKTTTQHAPNNVGNHQIVAQAQNSAIHYTSTVSRPPNYKSVSNNYYKISTYIIYKRNIIYFFVSNLMAAIGNFFWRGGVRFNCISSTRRSYEHTPPTRWLYITFYFYYGNNLII